MVGGARAGIRQLDLLEELDAAAPAVDGDELVAFLDRLDGLGAAIEAYASPELVARRPAAPLAAHAGGRQRATSSSERRCRPVSVCRPSSGARCRASGSAGSCNGRRPAWSWRAGWPIVRTDRSRWSPRARRGARRSCSQRSARVRRPARSGRWRRIGARAWRPGRLRDPVGQPPRRLTGHPAERATVATARTRDPRTRDPRTRVPRSRQHDDHGDRACPGRFSGQRRGFPALVSWPDGVPYRETARDRYALDAGYFSSRGRGGGRSRRPSGRVADRAGTGGTRPDRPVTAGDLAAMALIHELQHRAIDQAQRPDGAGAKGHGGDASPRSRTRFPSRPVYVEGVDPGTYLRAKTDGAPNRQLTTEELLLLWVANQNPAFMRYDDLFDEPDLAASTDYPRVVAAIRKQTAKDAEGATARTSWSGCWSPPGRHPTRLAGQLRWIRDNWPDIVDDDLLRAADPEPRRARRGAGRRRARLDRPRRRWRRHGRVGRAGRVRRAQEEPESFSQDLDWMPGLVLMAKSTYVWLDQLSRTLRPRHPDARRHPRRGARPAARAGASPGLWLIGLWERSHASQRIKQLQGNPEAVASAYSLMDYRIADDLGGEAAWRDLRDRAWARGIRLASDMVPNHMGIDSRWVTEHPGLLRRARRPALPRVLLDRPQPVQRRAGGHLPRGPLLRRLGRGRGVQARRPLERRRRATSTTATTAPASPGTTPRSWTTCAPTSGRRSSGPSSMSLAASRSSASTPPWCSPGSMSSGSGTRCRAVAAPSRRVPSRP